MEWLAHCGVRQLVINLHDRPEVIRRHFGDGSPWVERIHYSTEETWIGTAGGVKAMEAFFEETVIVWYGDNLCRLDLVGMAVHVLRL